MTRRYGRPGAGILWLGAVVALLGAASACGDDDGDDTQNGTGGALTGGKSGSGGATSGGGTQANGGSSGATSKGGSGGASGGSASGAGGAAPGAGEGGVPAEGGGGAGPVAGNPGAGSGGDAGSGAMAGAPSAGEGGTGQPGTGGVAGGSGGNGGGSDGGSGGAGPSVPVEYRSCESGAAVTRVELFRIDRENQNCTLIVVQQGQINCLDDLKSGGWCVIRAAVSDDVEACEAFQVPSNPVEAAEGEGTFTIATQPLAIDIDAVFEFPASGSLPQSVSVEADNCLADCVANDCRP